MYRTIVIAFSTLDGVIEDPDGRGGHQTAAGPSATARGGSRRQVQARPALETGALLDGSHDLATVLGDMAPTHGRLLRRHEPRPQASSCPGP